PNRNTNSLITCNVLLQCSNNSTDEVWLVGLEGQHVYLGLDQWWQIERDMMSTSGAGRYMAFPPSPSAPPSPHLSGLRSTPLSDPDKYLAELLGERNKLSPFMAVLPHCFRLFNQEPVLIHTTAEPLDWQSPEALLLETSTCALTCHFPCWFLSSVYHVSSHHSVTANMLTNADRYILFLKIDIFGAEILRVTTLMGNASVLGQSGLEHASPLATGGIFSNGGADVNGWASRFQSERPSLLQSSSTQNWLSPQGSSSGIIVKKTVRVDIPVDAYPNFNFVGRLLGPRGNSLKRVEASTECRVLIRGRGSIKDPAREEMMRGKPGYEHLNEPLHILVEAELPVEIVDARLMQAREILEDLLKPVDESQDFYKKQQLRELAMLNGTLREEGSPMSGSVSPFHNSLGNAVNECPDLRSGHWHHSASSNLFYVQCVYIEFGGGLKMVARSKGPIEFGEFAFIVLVKAITFPTSSSPTPLHYLGRTVVLPPPCHRHLPSLQPSLCRSTPTSFMAITLPSGLAQWHRRAKAREVTEVTATFFIVARGPFSPPSSSLQPCRGVREYTDESYG
ncbi:KH domain-containing protein isoform A, partial [Glycine soja]